ncbi:SNF2-family ATP dependent chromatin remodeling factor snf21 [Ephemerocybe angulata]|uniref:SNF2-family ATP dependent chromatin remodeling factor snf21 n=1 Tax=Ephemerocybe angulata TaxID=980116 RepID=A0A8H6HI68_9AGAR|nr:SNF2-family ATP dependent chromatin remodeling factor snf21 [Tulosesus angulatus]
MSSSTSSPVATTFEELPSTRATSTAASSPPASHAASEYDCATGEEDEAPVEGFLEEDEEPATVDEVDMPKQLKKLQDILAKSTIYSNVLRERMEEDQRRTLEESKQKSGAKRGRPSAAGKGKKRMKMDNGFSEVPENVAEDSQIFEQPALITGAKLKPYQLEGLQWMVSLDKNGISGILADEMGLGKTLQTIAFSAYLREHQNTRPFLVVCPLSVLHNWVSEYEKFAPTIPVCMYHGTPDERAEMRRTVMALPEERPPPIATTSKPKRGRPSRRSKKSKADDSDDEVAKDSDATSHFPVVVTTYDIIIRDRVHLAKYNWGYIVVDEGHRLKNLNCKLMKEIKQYHSAGRMILTGTPLHNNLAELWSLLNFILPDIFDDIDSFQELFNLPDLQNSLPPSQSSQIISTLHAILKPFLLRRLKVDVEMNLPPKKEYVLYAPLSVRQREAYDRVLDGGLRKWLIQGGTAADAEKGEPTALPEETKEEGDSQPTRTLRRRAGKKHYDLDGDDDKYFDMLERGEIDQSGIVHKMTREEEEAEALRAGLEHQNRQKVVKVNNMKLQNTVMQLRKVCSHPFLFDWPLDKKTLQPVLGEELVNASGKMMVLDRLLRELFRRKHKVLLFSQFTTMLNIIEDWAVDYMGWDICRIDGTSSPMERKAQMERFQTAGEAPGAPRLFLLSTRAGGLGINLVAADTVIFYDQDWNPQMDAQAQDRAHRIGQTRPVLIFRLVSAHTVETKIMQRATEKRKLEALVIAKGKFRQPAAAAATNKKETIAEMAANLLRLEGEKIEVVSDTKEGKASVLSDKDLEILLDRSPEVFAGRGRGWTSTKAKEPTSPSAAAPRPGTSATPSRATRAAKRAAFAVYEAPTDEGNDSLAKMFGEAGDDEE